MKTLLPSMYSARKQSVVDALVILGLLLINIILITIHFTSPTLAIGPLSSQTSTLLRVGVTVAATIFMIVVSKRLQHSLLRTLEDRLQKLSSGSGGNFTSNEQVDCRERDTLERLNREWRATLRIDTFSEKHHSYLISLMFLMCALITTSIVVLLTPTLTTRTVPYDPVIPDTTLGRYPNNKNRSCVGICENCNATVGVHSAFSWLYGNATTDINNQNLLYSAYDGKCPATIMMALAASINVINPDDHVYVDSGVAVERTAMGAPVTLYEGVALQDLSGHYGHALVRTTQCVPVMTSNPVRCQTGGETRIVNPTTLSILATNMSALNSTFTFQPDDQIYRYFSNRYLSRDSAMGKWMTTVSTPKLSNIFTTVIVIGAVTDPAAETPFAAYLAGIVGDPDEEAGFAANSSYTVTCIVNPRNAFEYRSVTLNQRTLGENKGSNMAQYLSGSEPCTPVTPTIGDKMFATAAIASHFLIKENEGVDGYFNTIARLAGYGRNTSFALPDSRNYLEDVLGVVSALAVSRMELGNGTLATAQDGQPGKSSAVVEFTRLGADSGWTLWLLVPPVVSLLVLSYYSVLSVLHGYAPGGSGFQGRPEQRPKRYAAESLNQLVELGWAAGRDYEKLAIVERDPSHDSS